MNESTKILAQQTILVPINMTKAVTLIFQYCITLLSQRWVAYDPYKSFSFKALHLTV